MENFVGSHETEKVSNSKRPAETSRFHPQQEDIEDELEIVPFLDKHDSKTSHLGEQHMPLAGSEEDSGMVRTSNEGTATSSDLADNSSEITNGECSAESESFGAVNHLENNTYEFRNNFEVVKLAESQAEDQIFDINVEQQRENGEYQGNAVLNNDGGHLQTSQDYKFLIQSLDASMVDKFDLMNANLTSSSCEDALSLLLMKKSINESVDTLNYFEFLPAELIVYIFSYLSTYELCKHVAPVCRQWRQLSRDQSLWKCIDFTHFKHLESLDLLWVVRRAPFLQKLVIRGRANITMAELAIITEFCPGIRDINLGFCDSLNCDMIQCIVKNCPKLTKINVEGCDKIDSKCIRLLTKADKLTHMNFSHCSLPDSSLKFLCNNLAKLVSINLDGISWTTDSVVVTMVHKHQDWLQEVELDGAEISDESLKYLSRCSHLRLFSMSFCECVTDKGLMYLKDLKNLEVLRLRKGTDFSQTGLITFFKEAHLSKLHSLNLSECSEINDAVVLEMVKSCGKNLQELALSWCWFITETGLISIVDHCSNLHVLDLLGIDKITGECLARVPEEMVLLRYLDLQQCNKIVDSLIYDVVRSKPDLQVLNYYGEKFIYCEELSVSDLSEEGAVDQQQT